VHDVEFKGAPDWFADATKTKISGLGEVPLTYDPPGAPEFAREEQPDAPDLARCWVQKGQPRQLKNLKNIPVLVVMSEASYHASYDHCTVKYLRAAGVNTTFMRLAESNIRGHGHMMMLEKNNDKIAAAMMNWLGETFRAEKR
jgi:pimeloyl-ACP methyl ester carboxylesterase